MKRKVIIETLAKSYNIVYSLHHSGLFPQLAENGTTQRCVSGWVTEATLYTLSIAIVWEISQVREIFRRHMLKIESDNRTDM